MFELGQRFGANIDRTPLIWYPVSIESGKEFNDVDLIVTERGRTQSAYMQGEEWTDYGTFESTLENLRPFILQAKKREMRQMSVRVDGDAIAIDFIGMAGVVISQIIISHNLRDRDMLISELRSIAQ